MVVLVYSRFFPHNCTVENARFTKRRFLLSAINRLIAVLRMHTEGTAHPVDEVKHMSNRDDMMNNWSQQNRRYVPAALFFVLLIYWVAIFSVNIPYLDEWATVVPLMDNDSPTLSELWKQHNEHRIFFPKLLILANIHLSHWDVRWQMMCSLMLAGMTFLVIAAHIRKYEKQRGQPLPPFLWCITPLLIFSFAQYENWLWGFCVSWQMAELAVVLGFSFLVKWRDTLSGKDFLLALLCGIVATFSMGQGLVYWPVGALLLLAVPQHHWKHFAVWCLVFLAVIIAYFADYTEPEHHINVHGVTDLHGLRYILQYPHEYLLFVLTFIGNAVTFPVIGGAILAGILGGYVFIMNIRRYRDKQLQFFFLLAIYGLLSAFMIGIGRTELHFVTATSSRYISLGVLFWVALLVITADKRTWYRGAVAIGICASVGYLVGILWSAELHQRRAAAQQHILMRYPSALDADMEKIVCCPYGENMQDLLSVLARKKLSLFRE